MLKNYVNTAIQVILRNKLYSLINVGGLAVGMTAVILIGLFVRDELAYDAWFPNSERIHRVEMVYHYPGRDDAPWAATPARTAEEIAKAFSGFEETVRVMPDRLTVNLGDSKHREEGFLVDENFFDVFDLPIVAGSRKAVLAENSSIAISQDMARKYFGDTEAVGQTLAIKSGRMDAEILYRVVAVFKNIPEATHFNTDFIALLDPLRLSPGMTRALDNWTAVTSYTYVKLRPGVLPETLSAQLEAFGKKASAAFINPPETIEVSLMPLRDIHLHSDKHGQLKPAGDYQIVVVFSVVAALVLFVGAINFTNLATAQAIKRTKELGIRKIFGASRKQLISQFLGEALLTTFIALLFGLVLAELLLPFFNQFVGKNLTLDLFADPGLFLAVVCVAFVTGLMGGAYPAHILAASRPETILRAANNPQGAVPWLSSVLMVVQFSISVTLIAVTAVIYVQTELVRDQDIGLDKSGKITFVVDGEAARTTFSQELVKLPGVKATTSSDRSWPLRGISDTRVLVKGEPFLIEVMHVSPNFFQFFDVRANAGRLFDEAHTGDFLVEPDDEEQPISWGAVVNESFLRQTGFPNANAAVDQTVSFGGRYTDISIVGVIADLQTRSAMEKTAPTIYLVSRNPQPVIAVDLDGRNTEASLEAIKNLWAKIQPGAPALNWSFIDDDFAALYAAQEERALTFMGFSLFAIFIAGLGLYGLAAFTAERRTREIGIRKVLGAQVFDIVKLLAVQFSKPVLIASLIAWPTTAYFMSDWLEGFNTRLDTETLVILLACAALVALLVAWVTVGGLAVRVGRANPIKALRYE